ncbi:PREDICTED: AAA-ATPase At4g30250-like [Prunus mume]|uniref:AAA-ATPase At4g30250-like n=1 Tax=Prunus mume TaxID=102107 RepID=A0ABM0NXT1_PRUMU|nr:PREDICTED: AAA-ATPase At4g30250-like [Prunus mume]
MEMLSQLWSLLGLLTVLQNVLPSQLLSLLHSLYQSLQDMLCPYSYFDVPEFNGYCGVHLNDLYRHVNLYLNSLVNVNVNVTATNPSSSSFNARLTLSRSNSSNRISFTVAPNHSVSDSFGGHILSWTHHVDTVQDSLDEKRSFVLKLPKRHRHALLHPYLHHLTARAEEFERVSRERRLFTNNGHASYDSGWVSVPFRHPSTFDTLALEPQLKSQLTGDLKAFANGKDFYHRVGRAWKRGYFLYGPPGSGKSSLIAAMANYLCYDVYDLELTKVSDNSELRALLIQTTNRSIVVIEDIDCSLDLTADRQQLRLSMNTKSTRSKARVRSRQQKQEDEDCDEQNAGRVTLSGLLNFTDGLWSCCGEERIIIFTTNHRDNVDPALLRCGRMDVHVNLGNCGPHAFRAMAKNYLGLDSHPLFEAVDRCVRSGGALTPAQVGEILLRNRGDADVAMKDVVSAMQARINLDGGGGGGQDQLAELYSSCDDQTVMMRATSSPESVLVGVGGGSPENWVSSSPPGSGRKKKAAEGDQCQRMKMKFLVRLRSLTKSDSGRRGVCLTCPNS